MTGRAATTVAALRALRLFNEKADKLEASSFTKKILTERSGVEISAKRVERGVAVTATRFGPDQESIDAFVLTFRFFVQNNEPSSFRNMADFYSDAGLQLDSETTRRFNEARDAVNAYLDEASFVQVDNRPLTHREIFEVFMWGGLAHAYAQRGRKETFDFWKSIPGFFQICGERVRPRAGDHSEGHLLHPRVEQASNPETRSLSTQAIDIALLVEKQKTVAKCLLVPVQPETVARAEPFSTLVRDLGPCVITGSYRRSNIRETREELQKLRPIQRLLVFRF